MKSSLPSAREPSLRRRSATPCHGGTGLPTSWMAVVSRSTRTLVERSIRPIALIRKNALFAGSDGGAETWAIIASLIECCKLVGTERYAYLVDVITRIANGHLNSQLDDLLPCGPTKPPSPPPTWPENDAYSVAARRSPFSIGDRSTFRPKEPACRA